MSKVLIFLTMLGAANAMAQESLTIQATLQTASDSMDYFFGINMGYSVDNNPYIKNQDLVIAGFIQALEGKAAWDANSSKTILMELLTDMAAISAPQPLPQWRFIMRGS